MNMKKCALSLFVLLMKMTLVSGITMEREEYNCTGEINTIIIQSKNCKDFQLTHNDLVIYSEKEGFILPILDHPTDNVFCVEGCPEIVSICHTFDQKEKRTTYTGVKVNTTLPGSREDSRNNSIRTLIIGLSCTLLIIIATAIFFICWCCQRRRGHQFVPTQEASNRHPNIEYGQIGTASGSEASVSIEMER